MPTYVLGRVLDSPICEPLCEALCDGRFSGNGPALSVLVMPGFGACTPILPATVETKRGKGSEDGSDENGEGRKGRRKHVILHAGVGWEEPDRKALRARKKCKLEQV